MSWEILNRGSRGLLAERVPICELGGLLHDGDSWTSVAFPIQVEDHVVLVAPKHVLVDTAVTVVRHIFNSHVLDALELEIMVDDWAQDAASDLAAVRLADRALDPWACWPGDGPAAVLNVGPLENGGTSIRTIEAPRSSNPLASNRPARVTDSYLRRAEWLENNGEPPHEFRIPGDPIYGMSGNPVFGKFDDDLLCFAGMVTAAIEGAGKQGCAVLTSRRILEFARAL